MSSKYTPEQQELFTKVKDTFNRLNMNGQGDAVEKVNFKKGELSLMKKEGKVMLEYKQVMKHFANLSSLEKFLNENLAYYMNKINGKVTKPEAVKAVFAAHSVKIKKTEASIKVEVDDKYKEFFDNYDNLKSTLNFLEMAEKQLGCPLEWSDDEKCFYIYDEDMNCKPEDLKKMLPNLIAQGSTELTLEEKMEIRPKTAKAENVYFTEDIQHPTKPELTVTFKAVEDDASPKGHFEDAEIEEKIMQRLNDGDGAAWFTAVVTVSDESGITGEDNLGGCDYNSFEEFMDSEKNMYWKDMINTATNNYEEALKSTTANKEEISMETLDKIKKDKELVKAVNELPALEKQVAKMKKEVPPIYNKILEKYDIKEGTGRSGDGSRITDYDKLHRAADSEDEQIKKFYDEANTELMKKYPGTKDGHCPLLVAQDAVIKKENQILDLLGKYYSFAKNLYKLEDRRQFLDVHKQLLVGAKAETQAIAELTVCKDSTADIVIAGAVDCPDCYGDGMTSQELEKGTDYKKCKKCNGSGKVSGVMELISEHVWNMFQDMATEPSWDQDQVDQVINIVKKKKPNLAVDFEKFVDMAGDLSNNYSELEVAQNKHNEDEAAELEGSIDKLYNEVAKFFDEKISPHLGKNKAKADNGQLTIEKIKTLSAALVEVQNSMKDGMHELNLAIKNKDLVSIKSNAKIQKLIKACNDADEAAQILWN